MILCNYRLHHILARRKTVDDEGHKDIAAGQPSQLRLRSNSHGPHGRHERHQHHTEFWHRGDLKNAGPDGNPGISRLSMMGRTLTKAG